MMFGKNANHLLESVIAGLAGNKRGRVLDLGCGSGDYSKRLKDLGFEVVAADIDRNRFMHNNDIEFRYCDITKELPFADNQFDYVLLIEVLEHLRNPYAVLSGINRIIKKGGVLILSTPNILSLKSRFRFFFTAAYEYFREPPLDQSKNPNEIAFNLHLVPYRYHELEYLLSDCCFNVIRVFTSRFEGLAIGVLLPVIIMQYWLEDRRSARKGGIDYRRIHKILLSKELLFGRHLIIKAEKTE